MCGSSLSWREQQWSFCSVNMKAVTWAWCRVGCSMCIMFLPAQLYLAHRHHGHPLCFGLLYRCRLSNGAWRMPRVAFLREERRKPHAPSERDSSERCIPSWRSPAWHRRARKRRVATRALLRQGCLAFTGALNVRWADGRQMQAAVPRGILDFGF